MSEEMFKDLKIHKLTYASTPPRRISLKNNCKIILFAE